LELIMDSNFSHVNIWGVPESQEALRQVADLCVQALGLPLKVLPEGTSFSSQGAEKTGLRGVISCHGRLVEDDFILLECELFRGSGDLRMSTKTFFEHLSALGDKVRLAPPKPHPDGEASYLVSLKIKATPLSVARASALVDELKHLNQVAKILQEELPAIRTDAELAKLYEPVSEFLEPVCAWPGPEAEPGEPLGDWAAETVDYLLSSCSVALAAPLPLEGDLGLAACAQAVQKFKKTLGRVKLPSINARTLVELNHKAPGLVVAPAMNLSLGTSPYELGNEMRALLSTLASQNRPAIFTGALEELQAVFHGGQGGKTDPLLPVVRHVPEIPLETLALFAVRTAGMQIGGLPAATEERLLRGVLEELARLSAPEQRRVLPGVARRAMNSWASGLPLTEKSGFAAKASSLSETLSGLSPQPRAQRLAAVQEHFVQRLTDPRFLGVLQENLLGQDQALEEFTARLASEVLTRPGHQPLRLCLEGTPATGKSESLVLTAAWLGVPYINFDAASITSAHTAAAQLLGSGRGIVGSHQSGRLEQAAKHHAGALIEVSDLDHAVPEVRSSLADLFLQVLDKGEAQSATGAMFSCANLIFGFSMNLPGKKDEKAHRGIGFQHAQGDRERRQRVVTELQNMLSGAFLSRIGSPILFRPLEGEVLAYIAIRAVEQAVWSAAGHLHLPVQEVVVSPKVGAGVLASLMTSVTAFGARTLVEHARTLAAQAILALKSQAKDGVGKILEVGVTPAGHLTLELR
jgi:hypothetical protein